MQFKVLQRTLDAKTFTQQRAIFEVYPEGDSVLDQDVSLSFSVTGPVSSGAVNRYNLHTTPRAGAAAFIDQIRVRSANGTPLLRLRSVGKFAAFQGLRHDQSDLYSIESFLSDTAAVDVSTTIGTMVPIAYHDPILDNGAANSREYMIDLRKLCTFLKGPIDIAKTGHLVFEFIWQQDNSLCFDQGSALITSHQIVNPRLHYDLLQGVPGMSTIAYMEPVLARQSCDAVLNGAVQRVNLQLGFQGEFVGGLVGSLLAGADAVPDRDQRSDFMRDTRWNLRANGKQLYPQDLTPAMMLSELELSQGRLALPAGCYKGMVPSDAVTMVTAGGGAPRGVAEYFGMSLQMPIDDNGLEVVFQRTGDNTLPVGLAACDFYVWGLCARKFEAKKEMMTRVI